MLFGLVNTNYMRAKIGASPILIFVLLVCNSCQSNSFYTEYSESDLYRIPLIKPYKLTQIYGLNAERDDLVGKFNSWQLNLFFADKSKSWGHVNVTDINVKNEVVYGHGKRTKFPPNDYFVIIPGKKIEKIFKTEEEWKQFLRTLAIDSVVLYWPWDIFDEFKENTTLPWYNPKKNIYPVKDFQ